MLLGWTVLDEAGERALRVGWKWGGYVWIPLLEAVFDRVDAATSVVLYSDEELANDAARAVGGVAHPVTTSVFEAVTGFKSQA